MLTSRSNRVNIKHELIIISIIILVGLSSAVYLYQLDPLFLIYYNDSISHLVRSRELVDSIRPGFEQLGTGWLPLPHFLLLPFSLVDTLFRSGFAGLAISLPSLAISSVFLFRIIRFQIGITYISIAGTLFYALNPNILYLGITAMTELPFILFFIIAAYYFQKYIFRTRSNIQDNSLISGANSSMGTYSAYQLNDLIKCTIFISLATLCRYEGWVLPFFLVPYIIVTVLKRKDNLTSSISINNREKIHLKYKAHYIYPVLVSLLSFSGIVLWMAWNAYYYKDPLEFQNAQFWSALWFTRELGATNTLYLNPFNVTVQYMVTALMIYGPILLILSIVGYISDTFYRQQGSKQKLLNASLYTFLLLPALVVPVSLLVGNAELNTRHAWFNARFLTLLSPIIMLLCSVFLANLYRKFKMKRSIMYILIGVLFLSQFPISYTTVVTFADGEHNKSHGSRPFVTETAEVLKSWFTGGKVLIITGSAQQNNIMQATRIPMKSFDTVLHGNAWKASFEEPWLHANYIVISKKPDASAADESKYWLDRQYLLDDYYNVVYENKYYKIMVKKGATKN